MKKKVNLSLRHRYGHSQTKQEERGCEQDKPTTPMLQDKPRQKQVWMGTQYYNFSFPMSHVVVFLYPINFNPKYLNLKTPSTFNKNFNRKTPTITTSTTKTKKTALTTHKGICYTSRENVMRRWREAKHLPESQSPHCLLYLSQSFNSFHLSTIIQSFSSTTTKLFLHLSFPDFFSTFV